MRLALCLGLLPLLFPAAAPAQTPEERKATITFLQNLQQPDGGFLPAPIDPKLDQVPRSSLRATSAALRALKYFGGQPKDAAAAAKYVKSCYDPKTGAFADQPGGKEDVFITAVGLMAVVETKLPLKEYTAKAIPYLAEHAKSFEDVRIAAAGVEAVRERPAVIQSWLKEVAKMRNADGTYGKGDARTTGGAVALILRVGGKLEEGQRDKVVASLQGGQRPDGGYDKPDAKGSDLETTYRVLRAFHMLKEKPKDVAKLRAFIAKCRNADGGYGVTPGQPSNVGGTYYAAIILHWLDESGK